MQNQKVAPEAVALSRRLRCATCERTRRPLPPRPTSLKATGPFNSRVCLDFVHIHDANKVGHLYLHILEPNGSYNVFYPVESRVPAHVFEVFYYRVGYLGRIPRRAGRRPGRGFRE